jgi:hypothetical protein
MSFKILFSAVKPFDFADGVDRLAGAPTWQIYENGQTTDLRLMQMDVAAAAPDTQTGWVFGTLAYERLASSRLASWGSPTAKCFRRYPKGHTATAAKARLVLLPVRHFEFDLGDTVSTGGVVLMRHAGPIKLFPILAA